MYINMHVPSSCLYLVSVGSSPNISNFEHAKLGNNRTSNFPNLIFEPPQFLKDQTHVYCVLQLHQVSSKSEEKQKSFIKSPFFCSEFQSVSRFMKIVHSADVYLLTLCTDKQKFRQNVFFCNKTL